MLYMVGLRGRYISTNDEQNDDHREFCLFFVFFSPCGVGGGTPDKLKQDTHCSENDDFTLNLEIGRANH